MMDNQEIPPEGVSAFKVDTLYKPKFMNKLEIDQDKLPFFLIIAHILRHRAQLAEKTIKLLLKSKQNRDSFLQAFTHKSYDEEDNYEYYEFVGDVTVNKCIAGCLIKRFPHLRCPDGVRVLTRLKIKLVSKKILSWFADMLGFWEHIRASDEERQHRKKPLLEDSFEAFIGLVEQLIDELAGTGKVGAGYRVCFNIIQSIFSEFPICGKIPGTDGIQLGKLTYNDDYKGSDGIVDPKTVCKELFDKYNARKKPEEEDDGRKRLGELKYISERDDLLSHTKVYIIQGDGDDFVTLTDKFQKVFLVCGNKKCLDHKDPDQYRLGTRINCSKCGKKCDIKCAAFIGKGTAALKADSEQRAAHFALRVLKKKGFWREMTPAYAKFCTWSRNFQN